MKYASSRGGIPHFSFEEALFSGFLSDGGLAIPENDIIECSPLMPLNEDQLRRWVAETEYSQVVANVLRYFISENEIGDQEIQEIVTKAFEDFIHPKVVEVKQLNGNLFVGELFHGPTYAFKDLSLCVLGRLMHNFLEKRRKHVSILVGTSGDTGSAAIQAVKSSPWIDLIVLFPKGRCTPFQVHQMITVLNKNIHCFEVEGTCDDLDVPIKACFEDSAFVNTHNLSSINSINWARVMVQAAHFFYLYGRICSTGDLETIHFVIPTGGAGHLTAGLIAKKLGLPIKIVSCVNINDVIHQTVQNGYTANTGNSVATLASAMDIQVPYNVERILYLLSGHNAVQVKAWMETLESEKELHLPQDMIDKLQEAITTHRVPDAAIRKSISKCWDQFQYKICPHTATGMDYIFHLGKTDIKHICMATASPVKFPEALEESGLQPESIELPKLPTKYEKMMLGENWKQILLKKIEQISTRSRPTAM